MTRSPLKAECHVMQISEGHLGINATIITTQALWMGWNAWSLNSIACEVPNGNSSP